MSTPGQARPDAQAWARARRHSPPIPTTTRPARGQTATEARLAELRGLSRDCDAKLRRIEASRDLLKAEAQRLHDRRAEEADTWHAAHDRLLEDNRKAQASYEELAAYVDPFADSPQAKFWDRYHRALRKSVEAIGEWVDSPGCREAIQGADGQVFRELKDLVETLDAYGDYLGVYAQEVAERGR